MSKSSSVYQIDVKITTNCKCHKSFETPYIFTFTIYWWALPIWSHRLGPG